MTAFRIGFGYDVHRLVPGRPLILGGVRIPSERGLAGHSDADVLLHAIADALLGAAALGDIGQHFPDTDPRWKDADSLELLRQVYHQVVAAGYEVANVDSTVVLERPRLRPYIDTMRANIARVLALPIEAVSVKATTSEGMGFVGIGEGAVAFAVCLLRPRTVES
ncbi:2-C-methyl-D-erythritol 2,4-cyclodiphosphate synthase [Rhodothermus marinus SG0.5JP17-172]|uniref:2-C-methyl-D-erythritol 2,4-cyclodiphosphate synthase n=1 Tax=Rhodothermus marinus TaxID=29549 RepID=UPI000223D9FA|nr:2-C-methyl-D-erythritol 2,4-cyclodiphosphate synthase [Rhodothermus marinus]AEN72974.1 2-C-methyl-D-erythritol 2,4-cyclodiphosphate synthase [Rhodothermus marinus SG0.5JP17-172]MBO2493077.1 2-C-methyl-D-erythritol 2,4-cyclodiphosphate synthase [Rhodothermus marinus]